MYIFYFSSFNGLHQFTLYAIIIIHKCVNESVIEWRGASLRLSQSRSYARRETDYFRKSLPPIPSSHFKTLTPQFQDRDSPTIHAQSLRPTVLVTFPFMAFSAEKLTVEDTNLDAEAHNAPPVRYLSLDDVYSASGSSILMSKKIKARKLPLAVESLFDDQKSKDGGIIDPSGIQRRERAPLAFVYSRRSKRQRIDGPQDLSFFDELVAREKLACQQQLVKVEICDDLGEYGGSKENGFKVEQLSIKKKKNSGGELMKLGVDSSRTKSLDRLRLRETRGRNVSGRGEFGRTKRKKVDPATFRDDKAMPTKKRWVRLAFRIP